MRVLSVSQINFFIKSLIEVTAACAIFTRAAKFPILPITTAPDTCISALKDEKVRFEGGCYVFSSAARRLRFCAKEGMRVIVRGDVVQPGGQYQLCGGNAADGVGALSLSV